jgi:hypothetical protein
MRLTSFPDVAKVFNELDMKGIIQAVQYEMFVAVDIEYYHDATSPFIAHHSAPQQNSILPFSVQA